MTITPKVTRYRLRPKAPLAPRLPDPAQAEAIPEAAPREPRSADAAMSMRVTQQRLPRPDATEPDSLNR